MPASLVFHRNGLNQPQSLKGTKFNAGVLQTSSGIFSFDELLGGGICLGNMILLREDRVTNYADIIGNYFSGQGLEHEQCLCVINDGIEKTSQQFVETLYVRAKDIKQHAISAESSDNSAHHEPKHDKMNIAWRYQSLPRVETELGAGLRRNMQHAPLLGASTEQQQNTPYCCTFDISKAVPEPKLREYAPLLSLVNLHDASSEAFKEESLMQRFDSIISHIESLANSSPKRVVRVFVRSFGSLYYTRGYPGAWREMYMFLYKLRALQSRPNSSIVALVTVPLHLYEASKDISGYISTWESLSDGVFDIRSFGGARSHSSLPDFLRNEFNGILGVVKLPKRMGLEPFCKLSLHDQGHLAFKLHRKRFQIETWRLPPADKEDEPTDSKTACSLNF